MIFQDHSTVQRLYRLAAPKNSQNAAQVMSSVLRGKQLRHGILDRSRLRRSVSVDSSRYIKGP